MSEAYKKIDHDFALQMEEYIRAIDQEFLKEESVWHEEYYQGRDNGPWHPAKILLQLAQGLSERIRKHNKR